MSVLALLGEVEIKEYAERLKRIDEGEQD